MLSKEQAETIAEATHVLRPTWNTAQLMGVMADDRIRGRRSPRDVAAALAWLALDPTTRQPTRLFEGGEWWGTAAPSVREHNTSAHIRRPASDDCDVCNRARDAHRPGVVDDHAYRQRNASGHGTPMTDEARARLAVVAEQRHQDDHPTTTTERTDR